jgi:hypothetical protein
VPATNANEVMLATVVALGGSLESGGQVCFCAFDRTMAPVVIYTFNLLPKTFF